MDILRQLIRNMRSHIGFRTIKTVVAVALCFVIYDLRGRQGLPIYSALSAIFCMRTDIGNSKNVAVQRISGTLVGAFYGLILLLVEKYGFKGLDEVAGYLLSSVFLIPVIVTTVAMKKKDSVFFSCSVFLSVAINHLQDSNPYFFVWNRLLDTVIGILVAMLVNIIRIPYHKNQDVLYVSGLDEVLLNNCDNIPDFGKRELNRMLDEGMHFTIATMRTPASMITPLKDINIRLPIIAMDGTALFSIREKSYLKTQPLDCNTVKALTTYLDQAEVHYFINSILQDTLFIYYGEFRNEAEQTLFRKLKTSPYRNYLRGYPGEDEAVVYLTLLLEAQTAAQMDKELGEQPFAAAIRWNYYPAADYPGYAYIKIYDADSSREKMVNYLRMQVGVSSSITFGSRPERVDVFTGGMNADEVARLLRRYYEPYFWHKTTKSDAAGGGI